MRRSLKHKGFSTVVGAVYPTDAEISREKDSWNLIYRKYLTAMYWYHTREFYHPEFKDVCEQIDALYPPRCTGQLHLFRDHEPGQKKAVRVPRKPLFYKQATPFSDSP